MRLLGTCGFRSKKIISEGHSVIGIVTSVKTCWWLKVNTKPTRAHALDGAEFPHIIHFTYIVDGREYTGSQYVSLKKRCPQIHETITIFYDNANPSKCFIKFTTS